jgi:hypothetical protein
MVGPAGDCLRRAVAQQKSALPLPRFVELRERRQRRARRQRGLLLAAFAAVTLASAAALRPQEQPVSIHAEVGLPLRGAEPSPSELVPVAPERLVVPDKDERESEVSVTPPAAVGARALSGVKPRALERSRAEGKKVAVEPDANGGARACAELARSGAAERALGCYESLAQGSGMVAELALFEQARLEGKMMRRPQRALLKLDSYRRRFPQGSLRAEVMLAQIEWLLAAGNKAGARQVVDEALGSGLLRERTAELQRLRSTLIESPAP